MMSDCNIVDYSHSFPDALIAQGRDTNFLAVSKLDTPMKRADGKMASFEVMHRWLSQPCHHEDDEAYVCVQGAEITYWQQKEIKQLVRHLKQGKEVNVFDHFFLN